MRGILSHRFLEKTAQEEQAFLVPEPIGKGKIKRIKIKDGLEIVISDIELFQDFTIQIDKDCDFFELNYCFDGETVFNINNQQHHINTPISNIYYFHNENAYLETQANKRSRVLEIRFTFDNLLYYFDDENDRKK
ncbi:hypothetical protein [Virgibacillus pantothenticus]|uniref:hypothetical protein n=1 Tax=Virgibacillus pantothenticus TaxID=1473 RepID=UPI0009854304|nr:hypothetical protein [Virgibacillus pantothenticus]